MVKIMQVWRSYEIKRCNKLSLGGKLKRLNEKEGNMQKDEQLVEKKRKMYMFWVN